MLPTFLKIKFNCNIFFNKKQNLKKLLFLNIYINRIIFASYKRAENFSIF